MRTIYKTKYQNTVCPVKKFRLYFVVKHFGFIDIFCDGRLHVTKGSDNTHECEWKKCN